MRSSYLKGAFGAFAATSFLLTSTAASAASSARYSGPDPLAVLTVMSGAAPAAVLCGAAATAAVDSATPGCVLPQIDAAASPATSAAPIIDQPIPPALPGSGGSGLGLSSPLLIGLLALAGGVGLYLLLKKSKNNNEPVSPA